VGGHAGLVTALPLLWFSEAARRLRFTTLGFFRTLAPTVQLVLALVFGEPFTAAHAVACGCIWAAIRVYALDAARSAPTSAGATTPPSATRAARGP
jgi:chloramphenicol-sensitive protein RarD